MEVAWRGAAWRPSRLLEAHEALEGGALLGGQHERLQRRPAHLPRGEALTERTKGPPVWRPRWASGRGAVWAAHRLRLELRHLQRAPHLLAAAVVQVRLGEGTGWRVEWAAAAVAAAVAAAAGRAPA